MQERLSDTLGPGPGAPESDDEAFEQVRARVQALISAARTLSDTCADLADALRPAVPGHAGDDPLIAGFGRLRAERTAALLDEAASAARGTLGLLHSAYGALDRGPRLGPPAPRSGASTWPDAFVEVPPRAFTVDDEAGTALERRPAGRVEEADATDPHGIPAIAGAELDPTSDELAVGESEPGTAPDESGTEEAGPETPAVGEFSLGTAPDEPAVQEFGLGAAPDEPAVQEFSLGAAPDEPAVQGFSLGTAPDEPGAEESELGLGAPEEPAVEEAGLAMVPDDADPPEGDRGSDNFEGLRGWASEPAEEPDVVEPDVAEPPVPEAVDEEPAHETDPEAEAVHGPETVQEPETGPESDTTEAPELPEPEVVEAETTPEPETVETPKTSEPDALATPETPADPLPVVAAESTQDGHPTPEHPTPEHAAPEPPAAEHAAPEPLPSAESLPESTIAEIAEDAVHDDLEALDGEGLRSWATYAPRPTPAAPPAEESAVSIGAHTRHDEPDEGDEPEEDDEPDGLATSRQDEYGPDEHSAADVDGEGLRSWAAPPETWTAPAQGTAPAQEAALAGWMVVDPDDEDDTGHPIRERTVAAAQSRPAERLTVGLDDPDGAGWHGDTVSAEPRSLSLVPPVPAEPVDRLPAEDPWAAESAEDWSPPQDLSGAAAFARAESPVWTAEPAPGASAAGDGLAVFPIAEPTPAAPVPEVLLAEPAAATISRQVEAARRHLQAALVVANGPSAPKLGALLTAVEQVLTAVTDLARETRGLLESGLADRTFPGEARFLCSPPWDGVALVGRDAYGDDGATPAGLARLLRALGYEAHSATSAGGVSGVQIRSERYAMQVALVEPVGGGRQRWSGALEWVDSAGANRTWAETLGPVELEDEELARRVDELLRRSIGSV